LPAELRDRCDRQPGAAVEQLFDREIRAVLTDFARKVDMNEAAVERGWELWREFLSWVRREKKGGMPCETQ
jgi:hypothetical protein